MSNKILRVLIAAVVIATSTSCAAGSFGSPRLEAGISRLRETHDYGEQRTVGVGVLFQGDGRDGWVGDTAARWSDVAEAEVDGSRQELDLGARYYLPTGVDWYRPFVGFGGTLQRVDLEVDGESSDDVTAGAYATLGMEAIIGRAVVGLQYRATFGVDLDVAGEETDLDAGAFLVTVGWGL